VVFREQESAVKHRPEWEKVKDAVHRGEVVAVVVWALDRIGRDRVAVSHELAEIARKCAAVVSVQESWIDQPIGNLRDLLIQQFTWFAETERKRLIERTKAGQARARAQGKRIGRPGLSVEKVKAARDAFECGLSAFRAARKVNIPETTLREYWRRWSGFNAYPGYPRKVSAGGGA
jgi:DNA invertase Pin-like site-specific DNA recombinase